jgi:hypothetical protein
VAVEANIWHNRKLSMAGMTPRYYACEKCGHTYDREDKSINPPHETHTKELCKRLQLEKEMAAMLAS